MLRRRSLSRVFVVLVLAIIARLLFYPSQQREQQAPEIRRQGVLDLVARSDKLDVHKHDFLQVRIGRDERPDLFTGLIRDGIEDFWERFQLPFMTSKTTAHIDQQQVLSSIEQLLTLNGWVAALCPTLSRPFGQSDAAYDDLIRTTTEQGHIYFVGMVIHSADHFVVDQLAVIVQLARRLGSHAVFVSMLDYASTDSTETLLDLCEAVLTLLNIPFRIRKVPPMTEDPTAAYYPLEEAHTRNLVLEPLYELRQRRNIRFHRVIWLKGFTCPNDIFETLTVSTANEAAMVCGMDWAQHNGAFIFSDRWRTRDVNGDQFRQSRSSSVAGAGPPRDAQGAKRYSQHLPFQVFCCESGTHVVDPEQTYYVGLGYRAAIPERDVANLSTTVPAPRRGPEAQCLDSSQMWFCRDLWVWSARQGVREVEAREKGARETKGGFGLGLGGWGWGSGSKKTGEEEAPSLLDRNRKNKKVKRSKPIPQQQKRHGKRQAEEEKVEVEDPEYEQKPPNEDAADALKLLAGDANQRFHNEPAPLEMVGAEPINAQPIDRIGVVQDDIRVVDDVGAGAGAGGLGGGGHAQRVRPPIGGDVDANVGSDFDAMPEDAVDEVHEPGQGDEGQPADSPNVPDDKPDENPQGDVKEKPGQGQGQADEESRNQNNVDSDEEQKNEEPEEEEEEEDISLLPIPNSEFRPARILVNPRCVTTYAGVSHAQLALDLFGPDDSDLSSSSSPSSPEGLSGTDEGDTERSKRDKYVLDDWEGAPESFVCQEQRTTGGRKAPKTQRRLGFSVWSELGRWEEEMEEMGMYGVGMM